MRTRLSSTIDVEHWPGSDQAAWRRTLDPDPLAPGDGGGGSYWRPSTREFMARRYGNWLFWLEGCDLLDLDAEPLARATPANVRAYWEELAKVGYADHSIAGRIQALSNVLGVMAPNGDIGFIIRGYTRIARHAHRKKNLALRLQPASAIFQLGFDLVAQGEMIGPDKKAGALLVRDGLLIGLWASRALRCRNLSLIELDRNLTCDTEGWGLQFTAEEMKSRRAFSCRWPVALAPALGLYLEVSRPALMGAGECASSKQLWISSTGRDLTIGGVSQAIGIKTRRAFGRAINPHLARHILATEISERRPENIRDVPPMLGHASSATAEKFYNLANSFRATGVYQAVILDFLKSRRANDEH